MPQEALDHDGENAARPALRHREIIEDTSKVDCIVRRAEMIYDTSHESSLPDTSPEYNGNGSQAQPLESSTSPDMMTQEMWICEPLDNTVKGAIYRLPTVPSIVEASQDATADAVVMRTSGCRFEQGAVTCPHGAESMQVLPSEENYSSRKLARSTGTLRAGVLRIFTNDSVPRNTAQEVHDLIFKDNMSVHRQLQRCSNGVVSIQPLGATGVFDVYLDVSIDDFQYSDDTLFQLINMASDQADIDHAAILGGNRFRRSVDLFMISVPRGSGRWAAFAVIGGSLSAYNDEWVTYLAAQAHEIGHNMGLDHAFENGQEYRETVGYMGSAPREVRGPQRCFNGANYWSLQWHRDRSLEMQWGINSPLSRQINVAAFVDYALTVPGEWTVVKVTDDLFISYNRAKTFNVGTDEYPDRLLVVQQYPKNKGTDLLAALGVNNFYSAPVGNRTLKIQVCFASFGSGASADLLRVGAGFEDNVCGSTSVITTTSPTPEPTPIVVNDNNSNAGSPIASSPPIPTVSSSPSASSSPPTPDLTLPGSEFSASTGGNFSLEKGQDVFSQPLFIVIIGACILFCCIFVPFLWCLRREKRSKAKPAAPPEKVVKDDVDSRSVSTSSDDSAEFKDKDTVRATQRVVYSSQLRTDTRRHPYMASPAVPRRESPHRIQNDPSSTNARDGLLYTISPSSPRVLSPPPQRRVSPPPYVRRLSPDRLPPMEEMHSVPYSMRSRPDSDLITREMYRRSVRQAMLVTEPSSVSDECCLVPVSNEVCWSDTIFCTPRDSTREPNDSWWQGFGGWFT